MDYYQPAVKKRRLDLDGNFMRCYSIYRPNISIPPVVIKPVAYPYCQPSTSRVETDEEPQQEQRREQFILLRPEFEDVFIQCINYLDGQSFLNLALTSKETYNFCMNTRGIAILQPKGEVRADKTVFVFDWFNFSYEFSFPYTEEQTKNFHNKPIFFQISTLNLNLPDKKEKPNFLMDFCRFLDAIRVRHVNRLIISGEIEDYSEDLIRLFKVWKLKTVKVSDWKGLYLNELQPDIAHYFMNKVQSFEYGGTNVGDDLIAKCSTPKIRLTRCKIGRKTLDRIIERWVNGQLEIDYWKLSASFSENQFYDCTDPYVAIPYEYDGPLPTTPPLAFFRKSIVYFYRKDWKLLGISFCSHCTPTTVTLRLCERASYPNVLKYLLT